MKILVVSNLYPPDMLGGYELGCRQVVDGLRRRGHDVRVLTAAPRRPVRDEPHVLRRMKLTEIWSRYLFEHGHALTAHLTQFESHRINSANIHSLLAELEDFRPDVVYPWMLAGIGGLGLMACLDYLSVPWAWHLMDDLPRLLCEGAGRVVPGFAREFQRRLGDGNYLACSQRLVDEIEEAGFRMTGRVEVLPNWVESAGSPPTARTYLRGGVLRIAAAAGVLDRRGDKGIDLAIRAAAHLRERGHDAFRLDIYGREVDAYFGCLIRALDLGDHVGLLGPKDQSELLQLYGRYDLFAFPTREREPFGFAALEAMSRGCVPVVTATCGLSEWFVHGVHVVKAPRDPVAFADAFESAMVGGIDLATIGRRAMALVRREFHMDAALDRIEKFLGKVASDPRRPAAGTSSDAYRLALLAERLGRVIIHDSLRDCA